MFPDQTWFDRLLFHSLHLHNSWIFLPASSMLAFVLLVLLKRRRSIVQDQFHILIFAFGILPFVIFTLKDARMIFENATLGYVWAAKSAYLVIALPTLVLFIVSLLLLALHQVFARTIGAESRWTIFATALLLGILQVIQSMWLFEADASL